MAGKKTDEELVIQLLATAESSTHPDEARLARERAERLMVRLGITEAMARARGDRTREQIVQLTVPFTGTYRVGLLHLAVPVARGVGCRALRSRTESAELLYVVGFSSDAARAVQLVDSLGAQGLIEMWRWWKAGNHGVSPDHGMKARRSFLLGFGHEAGERLRAAEADAVTELGAGTDIVLRDRGREVDDYVTTLGTRRARGLTASRAGLEAGAMAAATADLSDGRGGLRADGRDPRMVLRA